MKATGTYKVNRDFFAGARAKKGAVPKSCVSYYAGGMLQPGNYGPGNAPGNGGYRYGWNTQERVDEIAGAGNHYTAQFWEYDSRTIRRWNQDPKPNPSISNYAAYAGNPIWFSDPLGDTLRVGANKQSKSDILSLARGKNQQYVKFNDNQASLDFGDMSEKDRQKILKKDKGLGLIQDMASSDKNFLYEASSIFLGRSENGSKFAGTLYSDNNHIINASEGGFDSNGGLTYRPREGYDGQVVIHPNASYSQTGTVIKKARASIVFHELAENYERTHNGVNYLGLRGAHNLSIGRERSWHGRSSSPGQVSGVDPVPAPSQSDLDQMKNYMEQ